MRDEEPPLPPPSPAPSRLKRTLHTLRSPFRSASPFHIGPIARAGSTKSCVSDGEIARDERTMRKRNKKQRADAAAAAGSADSARAAPGAPADKTKKDAGGFIKRMGSFGKKRTETVTPAPPAPAAPPKPERERASVSPVTDSEQLTPEPSASPIAAEHPIATRPFTKAAWKKNSVVEMDKPVEEPSPESAQKRRIAFVGQTSEEQEGERGERGEAGERGERGGVGSLEEAVALARSRLAAAGSTGSAGAQEPSHSRDDIGAGEEGCADVADGADEMPAYGDLIEPEQAGNGGGPSHATASSERREHLYKILVIGELGTGKTSIIKRYVHQFFSQHYRATIGVDFALKVLNWDANTIIRLQLWDIAGQERFGNMTRVYYKEAVGAFIVFDVSRVATFDAVVKWKNDLDTKVQLPDGSPIPCILLANKCDQQKEGIVNSPSKMDDYCREKGFAGWFETSAKENINIEEAARSLVNKILLNDKLLHSNDKDGEKFALEHKIANGENSRSGGGGKSCMC